MNDDSEPQGSVFFQQFKMVLNEIRVSTICVSNNTVVLTVSSIFSISVDQQNKQLWTIQPNYDAISALNPATEIELFLCRLTENKLILSQDCDNFFSIVCHYVQNLFTDIEQHKLFEFYRITQSLLFGSSHHSLVEQEIEFQLDDDVIQNCLNLIRCYVEQIQQELLRYCTHPDILRWYFLSYRQFNIRNYYTFERWVEPAIMDLKRWEKEHNNRLLWFLYWQDLTGVSNPGYFSYQNLSKFRLLGAPIFEHKGSIKKLFALSPDCFSKALKLAFSQDYQKTFMAMIIIKFATETQGSLIDELATIPYVLPSAQDFEFDRELISQYAHALKLISQNLQQGEIDDQFGFCLTDFLFGNKIENSMYTQIPNIVSVHPKMTLKSALRHSERWHRQSQYLEAKQFQFSFMPQAFEFHGIQFELIANPTDLSQEANDMQHCIVTYGAQIAQRSYYCFRVYAQEFRGTLGLKYHEDRFSYEFNQLTGERNRKAPEHIVRIAKAFADHLSVEDVYFDDLQDVA